MINKTAIMDFLKKREAILLLTIIVMCIIIQVNAPEFMQINNLLNVLVNNSMYGIMAIGMTIIMITGNIDISIGAQFAIIGVVSATLARFADTIGISTPSVIFLASILLGIILGSINGYLAIKIRLPAVILTLGTLSIMRGALLIITSGSWVVSLPNWLTGITSTKLLGIHIPVYIWIVTAILAVLILRYTAPGRNTLAYGGNPTGAIRIGISRDSIYRFAFSLFGATVGLGSTIYIAQIGSAQPAAGLGYEFTVVGAVVIGGNSLTGGKASIIGTCLGVLLLGISRNALVLMSIPVYWQSFVTGMIIVSAIVLSNKNEN